MIEAGGTAPDFTAPTQDGTLTLSSLRGKRVALYFYPKDNTPGCTVQACSLRDGYDSLMAAGIQPVGVSPDGPASHAKFAARHGLPFPLVSDEDHAIADRYGVWGPKKLFAHLFDGVHRTTFLIDEAGQVVDVITRPSVGDHAAEVIRRFEGAA